MASPLKLSRSSIAADATCTAEYDLVPKHRKPHPDPCRDCGRRHLRGEHVQWRVPTTEGGSRVAWEGCCDCWVRRTSPGAD